MKKINKILATILCIASFAGTFALSACGGNKPSDENQGNNTQTEGGNNTQTGDSGNQGDNTQAGDSGNQGDNTQTGDSGNQGDSTQTGDSGNQGDNTQTGDNENQGDNTQTGDENEPEHVPVTTVANADEWKKAFDVFSNESFSFTSVVADGYYDRTMTGVVDVTNLKLSMKVVATNPDEAEYINTEIYLEYGDNISCQWDSQGNEVTKDNIEQGKTPKEDFAYNVSGGSLLMMPLYYTFYASGNLSEGKTLSELYSEFSYKDGRYVSETIKQENEDEENIIIITLADGVVSEFEFLGGSSEQRWRYTIKISDVNKTTVTVPEGAREAIDAEKAKG